MAFMSRSFCFSELTFLFRIDSSSSRSSFLLLCALVLAPLSTIFAYSSSSYPYL